MEGNTAALLYGIITAFATVAILYVLNCIEVWRKKRTKSGIRVIKKGKIPTKRVECLHCHSIIQYDTMKVENEQYMDEYFPYIICPVCNEQIMLGQEEGGEK